MRSKSSSYWFLERADHFDPSPFAPSRWQDCHWIIIHQLQDAFLELFRLYRTKPSDLPDALLIGPGYSPDLAYNFIHRLREEGLDHHILPLLIFTRNEKALDQGDPGGIKTYQLHDKLITETDLHAAIVSLLKP